MKTLALLALAAAFVGCTTTPTTTTTTTTSSRNAQIDNSATNKRVYTQSDLQRSGRANTGAALRTIDPDISGGGQ